MFKHDSYLFFTDALIVISIIYSKCYFHPLLLGTHQQLQKEKYKLICVNSLISIGINQVANTISNQERHVEILTCFVNAQVIFVAFAHKSMVHRIEIWCQYILQEIPIDSMIEVFDLDSRNVGRETLNLLFEIRA